MWYLSKLFKWIFPVILVTVMKTLLIKISSDYLVCFIREFLNKNFLWLYKYSFYTFCSGEFLFFNLVSLLSDVLEHHLNICRKEKSWICYFWIVFPDVCSVESYIIIFVWYAVYELLYIVKGICWFCQYNFLCNWDRLCNILDYVAYDSCLHLFGKRILLYEKQYPNIWNHCYYIFHIFLSPWNIVNYLLIQFLPFWDALSDFFFFGWYLIFLMKFSPTTFFSFWGFEIIFLVLIL